VNTPYRERGSTGSKKTKKRKKLGKKELTSQLKGKESPGQKLLISSWFKGRGGKTVFKRKGGKENLSGLARDAQTRISPLPLLKRSRDVRGGKWFRQWEWISHINHGVKKKNQHASIGSRSDTPREHRSLKEANEGKRGHSM